MLHENCQADSKFQNYKKLLTTKFLEIVYFRSLLKIVIIQNFVKITNFPDFWKTVLFQNLFKIVNLQNFRYTFQFSNHIWNGVGASWLSYPKGDQMKVFLKIFTVIQNETFYFKKI